jgi:Fur family transcriptional regulator, peroxide stress response regulator
MELDPKAVQDRLNHFKNEIRRSGMKLTFQRLEIFREVAKSGDHPDAETIYKGVRERVPTVSLDTVYRTLWLLLDLKLLTTLGPPRERMRFDANLSSHHHFFCTKCGMTRDFYSEEFDRLKIPNTIATLGSVEKAQVEVSGICLRCAKEVYPQQSAGHKKENL